MKYRRIFLALAILALASLACQALTGGGDAPGGESSSATQPSGNDSSIGGDNAETSASGFPITADAYNVIDIGDGSVLFYTKMSLEEIMEFYRDVYVSQGYTERGLLTVTSDTTFSMVFDGDPSGEAVVIQSVDLGDGSCTVSIRLENV